MTHYKKTLKLVAISLALAAGQAWAHGNVTPQAVDTKGLSDLGDEWLDTNPYREGHPEYDTAVTIGASAYNQNCAACHGLDGISGASTPTCVTWRPATTGMSGTRKGSSTEPCATAGCICRRWPTSSARKHYGRSAPGWKRLP